MAHRSGVHCLRSRDTRLRDALQRVAALQRKAEGGESALLKVGLKTSLALEVNNHRIINHPQASHNSPIILPKIAKCMGCTKHQNVAGLLLLCEQKKTARIEEKNRLLRHNGIGAKVALHQPLAGDHLQLPIGNRWKSAVF